MNFAKLIQLVSLSKAQGLDFELEFRNLTSKILRRKGGYYDPPFKCRVPKSKIIGLRPYSPKDYSS